MKNKFTIVTPLVLLVITLGFYACKKDYNSTSPAGDQYKNLDAKTAKIAQWYDDEASNSKNKTFASQNHADWTKLYNAKQQDEVTLYALPLYQKDSVYRELNINQVKDENYGLIKEYILHPQIKETELKFYTVSGRLIESGLLTVDNLYIRKKVEKGNTIRLMGSEDNPVSGGTPSNPFTWGGSNPLPGVTITGTYTPTTFPAPPTFGGSDGHGGTNYGGGGGGAGGGGGGTPTPTNVPNLDLSELADYPEFKKVISNLPAFLKKYNNIVKALSYYTGFSESKINELMQPGKGPKIFVVDNLKSSDNRPVLGQYDRNTGRLQIDGAYVRGLDIVKSPERYEIIGLLLTVTTLHEFVHYGRDANNLPYKYNGYEAGLTFEQNISPPSSGINDILPDNAVDWLKFYPSK